MKETHLLLIVNTSTCCRKQSSTDKFGVLYRVLHVEFPGFNRRVDVQGLSHFGS